MKTKLTISNVSQNEVKTKFDKWKSDRLLVEIDLIAASGYTGRVIWIGGNNTSPDSSSGGYNGLAAKLSLETKGFSIA